LTACHELDRSFAVAPVSLPSCSVETSEPVFGAVDAFSSEGAMIQIDVRVQGKQSQIIALGYHLSLYGHLLDSGVVTGGGVD